MPYSDKPYFLTNIKESELNNLTKDDAGVPTDANLVSAIADADSLIDGYLKSAGIVTLPIEPVPNSIRKCSYQIALYYLHDRIQYNQIPERVKDNYDAALNYLKDVANGSVSIGDVAEENVDSSISYTVEPPVHTRNSF